MLLYRKCSLVIHSGAITHYKPLNRMDEHFPAGDEKNEEIVTNWLDAVNEFRTQYLTLITLTSQPLDNQTTQLNPGQCPRDSLLTILMCMKVELESLAHEMDQVDLCTATRNPQHCERLRKHTQRLNNLSKKAQIRLKLVGNPSS